MRAWGVIFYCSHCGVKKEIYDSFTKGENECCGELMQYNVYRYTACLAAENNNHTRQYIDSAIRRYSTYVPAENNVFGAKEEHGN